MSTKLIRRALVASGLFIGAAVAFSPTAFAGTTADVGIGGSVESTIALAVTGTANTTIDLGPGKTEATVKVAGLEMGTNSSQGLTLTTSGTFNLNNGTNGGGRTNIPFKVGIGVGSTEAANYGDAGDSASGIDTAAAARTDTAYGLWIQYNTGADFQD
ncbi:MAG: hypothetical protein ACYT04_56830, partial [Nostoc sp.]